MDLGEGGFNVTFTDDDWRAVFGDDDEEENREPEDKSGEANVTAQVASPLLNPPLSSFTAATNEANVPTTDAASKAVQSKEEPVVISSFEVIDLCIKYRASVRANGNTEEADALDSVGFMVYNMLAKVVQLEQRNEPIHFGSLMMEAAQSLMSENPGTRGRRLLSCLMFCTDSIRTLIDMVRKKISSAAMGEQKEVEIEPKENEKMNSMDNAAKLADESRKPAITAACVADSPEGEEKRSRCEDEQEDEHSIIHPSVIDISDAMLREDIERHI